MIKTFCRPGRAPAVFLITALGLTCLTGCGKSGSTITGAVTLDGQPVDSGSVVMQPADGMGPTCGGPIEQGKYHVSYVPPGKKIVQVIFASKAITPEEFEEMATGPKNKTPSKVKNEGDHPKESAAPVNSLIGNNQVIDVGSGSQTIDLALKSR